MENLKFLRFLKMSSTLEKQLKRRKLVEVSKSPESDNILKALMYFYYI